jgi:hypothetical protein
MNKPFPHPLPVIVLALVIVLAAAPALRAQTGAGAPSFRELAGELAAAAPGGAITLPDTAFTQPSASAAGKLQRGVLLYVAAGRAREINNPPRSPDLAAAAKTWLVDALSGLAAIPSAASRCQYYLGMIAEQHEGDLAGAQTRYQQALLLNPQNKQAGQALARVQFTLTPPQANN